MKNIAIWVLIVVVLIGGAYLAFRSAPVEAPTPISVGSVTGPEVFSPFFTVDNVTHEYRSMTFNGGTSTPCSFRSPSATSTLLRSSFQVTNATNTAFVITLATSSTMNATGTTNLLVPERAIAANLMGTWPYVGSTTPITALDTGIVDVIPPNTYVTYGVEGFGGYTAPSEFGGTCKAEFLVN